MQNTVQLSDLIGGEDAERPVLDAEDLAAIGKLKGYQCRTEAAPPEHRLARAGLDQHRFRRPQRRLRPDDAARPVGVALPNKGQP